MTSDTRPIVVGGCHRSGTSLVRRMLNAHSRIYCGPEVKFLRDLHGDYFQDPLHHLRFTTSARAIAPEADLLEILGRAYVNLQERAASHSRKVRWADKNPENVLYLDDWRQLLGEGWLFVQVLRNPLDTVASMKEARFPLTIPADLGGRIAMYKRYTQAGLDFADGHPERCYQLVYERLVSSPERETAELMRWLGEEFEQGQLAFNSVAHQRGLEDPKVARTACVHAESVGRWRRVLSRRDARTVWLQTRDVWQAIDPEDKAGVSQWVPLR